VYFEGEIEVREGVFHFHLAVQQKLVVVFLEFVVVVNNQLDNFACGC
jgi:hypothetical protein